jgi:hypothetical protein
VTFVWPPQCCVAALVAAALKVSGAPAFDPMILPKLLGTRVGPEDANPLELPVAKEGEPTGVSLLDAVASIPQILTRLGSPFSFRHVPLKTITFGQYDDVLATALERKCVVALGVNFSLLTGRQANRPALHVLRVIGVGTGNVSLLDDSGECDPPTIVIPADIAMQAVLTTPGGFWIFGPHRSLSLPCTLPWEQAG